MSEELTEELTAGEMNSLLYWWETSEDIRDSFAWGRAKDILPDQHPELWTYWNQYLASKKAITLILKEMEVYDA
jgi:hypothetical protein